MDWSFCDAEIHCGYVIDNIANQIIFKSSLVNRNMNDLEFKNEYRSYSVQGGMILEFSEIFLTQIFRSGQQVIEVFAGGRVFQTRF